MKHLFRREIQQSQAYELKAFPRLIKLNQNELPIDLPQKLKSSLVKKLKNIEFNRYPLTQPLELQKKLAQQLKVKKEQLIFSNGSNVMIQALILATANQGKVLMAPPTFGVYENQAKLLGNKILAIPLAGKEFKFPKQKLLTALKREKPNICFLCNPNAPTGTIFSRDDLLAVVKAAKCLVVVDEAYYQFSKQSLIKDLAQHPNLLILRTFSKGFGLGGIRLGYAIAHPEVITEIKKVLLPFCIPSVVENIALETLGHLDHFDKQISLILKERERVFQTLQSIPHVHCFDSATNFILFKVPDAQACFTHLVRHGVLIRDFSKYPRLKNCLRVSIGAPQENDVFLRAMLKLA